MKKNYNQPMVEATNWIAGAQALCVSPEITVSSDPIPEDNGGD